MTPSFGALPSERFERLRDATTPGFRRGATATALEGSMMIFHALPDETHGGNDFFLTDQENAIDILAENGEGAREREARKPSAMVSLESSDCKVPVERER